MTSTARSASPLDRGIFSIFLPKSSPASDAACPAGAAALLSIAAIAFHEDLGREMCLRMIEHILQYGGAVLRRTVPLALCLLFTSNPKQQVGGDRSVSFSFMGGKGVLFFWKYFLLGGVRVGECCCWREDVYLV